jgi:hypothetical protein
MDGKQFSIKDKLKMKDDNLVGIEYDPVSIEDKPGRTKDRQVSAEGKMCQGG